MILCVFKVPNSNFSENYFHSAFTPRNVNFAQVFAWGEGSTNGLAGLPSPKKVSGSASDFSVLYYHIINFLFNSNVLICTMPRTEN